METSQSVKVQYDVMTKRVDVTYGDRCVTVSGKYETIEEARKAVEVYARRWLIKK
jgi:rRNA processing protein Krr1/Pno1